MDSIEIVQNSDHLLSDVPWQCERDFRMGPIFLSESGTHVSFSGKKTGLVRKP
jgi:hypothetical protein